MLITLMFLVVAKKLRTFSSLLCLAKEEQEELRRAGAGREHGQAASPSRTMEIFHTMDLMRRL